MTVEHRFCLVLRASYFVLRPLCFVLCAGTSYFDLANEVQSTKYKGPSSNSFKLLKKSDVVLEQQPDVIEAIHESDHAIDT